MSVYIDIDLDFIMLKCNGEPFYIGSEFNSKFCYIDKKKHNE